MAQTLPIFAFAKAPLGITLVVAQLAINRGYTQIPTTHETRPKACPLCGQRVEKTGERRQAQVLVPEVWSVHKQVAHL
jgi:hypothetical protein